MAKIVLKDYLEDRGIKSNWLANRLGMSSAALSKLLNGKTDSIKLDFVEKVCAELNCCIADIMKLDGDCE